MSGLERMQGETGAFERVEGDARSGLLLLCDHASNAIPAEYGNLGLGDSALQRHIAYDIGAARVTRRIAERLGAPALLTTYSRLLIDPNRGEDDPTLVMRYSDGATVPGNARVDDAEIARRVALHWRPYREAIRAQIAQMTAAHRAPAVLSIHSFTPVWRGAPRSWKLGVLWDSDPRLPRALLDGFAGLGLAPEEIGDNAPYDGALVGDTIDDCATPLGLSNALLELRQDLIGTAEGAREWADKVADVLAAPLGDPAVVAPADFGARTGTKVIAAP